jgi:hypothetical protein
MSDHQRVERATKNAKFSYSDRLALRRRSGAWWKRYTNRILRAIWRRDERRGGHMNNSDLTTESQ